MIDLQISRKIFNDAYLPYLTDYSHKEEVYYGGAGSGKSVFVAQKILFKALTYKRKVLIIRKVQASHKDSCWMLMLDILSQWHIRETCQIRISDYTIELPNGSILLFKGLDDREKIKSIVGITDIWVEEATALTKDDYDQLRLRLRANRKYLQTFVSFNPISKANWVYKRWFDTDDPLENTLILKTTYKDNKFLPAEYLEVFEEQKRNNPTYYRIYALGEFCTLDRLVFNNWTAEEFDYREIKGKLLVGLDFGFTTDTTALVSSVLDEENKTIYVFNTWGDTNKTNDDIAKVIKALGLSKSVIIADSAEPKSIEELRRAGITRVHESVKGKDSIIHGIQRLQQYKIIVHTTCSELITELENYAWKKDRSTDEYKNEPVDKFNHYIDALRYSLQCVDKGNKLKTMSKDRLF